MNNKLNNKMFNGIDLNDYNYQYDLQKCYFLRDCLNDNFEFKLIEGNILIFKKIDNGICEEISLDELIFYIHTDVAKITKGFRGPPKLFENIFGSVDTIKKTVENMKIILKYDKGSESGENNEYEGEKIMIAKSRNINDSSKDNSTLAF